MITTQLQMELQPIRQELTILQANLTKKHTQVTETILQMQAQQMALTHSPFPTFLLKHGGCRN